MTIRLAFSDSRHRLAAPDPRDPRLAWTRCGVRFAWGTVTRRAGALPACEGCHR